MITNEKVVNNFNVIKNHYDIFPLTANLVPSICTPSPPQISGRYIEGTKYGRQWKNVIMNSIQLKSPDNFLIGHHAL